MASLRWVFLGLPFVFNVHFKVYSMSSPFKYSLSIQCVFIVYSHCIQCTFNVYSICNKLLCSCSVFALIILTLMPQIASKNHQSWRFNPSTSRNESKSKWIFSQKCSKIFEAPMQLLYTWTLNKCAYSTVVHKIVRSFRTCKC